MKILLIMLCLLPSVANAFEVNRSSMFDENSFLFVPNSITSPVHENLVAKSVEIKLLPFENGQSKVDFIRSVADGARWNDDPLNLLNNHKKDFGIHFLDSCRKNRSNEIDVTWDLFYRTHCGDMQFLHSMASDDNESAVKTTSYITAWLEFTYKIANGAMPHDYRFRSVQNYMSQDGVLTFKKMMISPNGGRELWTAETMFSMECDRNFALTLSSRPTELKCNYKKLSKQNVMDMALGSLLHIIQDSYTKSHTNRSQSGIVSYGRYTKQSSTRHKEADKMYEIIKGTPELITISNQIIVMVLADRNNGTDSWGEFSKIVQDKLFCVIDKNALPGDIGYK